MKAVTRTDHLEVILRKMCEFVGADYSVVDSHPKWFMDYSWTQDTEHQFSEWMCQYLYDNAAARREIMGYPSKNKKFISRVVFWFIFQFGWRYVDGITLKYDKPLKFGRKKQE